MLVSCPAPLPASCSLLLLCPCSVKMRHDNPFISSSPRLSGLPLRHRRAAGRGGSGCRRGDAVLGGSEVPGERERIRLLVTASHCGVKFFMDWSCLSFPLPYVWKQMVWRTIIPTTPFRPASPLSSLLCNTFLYAAMCWWWHCPSGEEMGVPQGWLCVPTPVWLLEMGMRSPKLQLLGGWNCGVPGAVLQWEAPSAFPWLLGSPALPWTRSRRNKTCAPWGFYGNWKAPFLWPLSSKKAPAAPSQCYSQLFYPLYCVAFFF